MERFAAIILGVAIHEVGHLVAAKATGSRVDGFGFNWRGPHVVITVDPPCRRKVVETLLAGPAANMIFAPFAFSPNPWLGAFGLANIVLAIGNLLLPMSDGIRAVNLWRAK